MPIQKKIPSLEEVEALINDATENFKDSIKNPTVLSSEDLNTLYGDSKLGYYFGGGGNSCGNKPEGVSAFGLFVVKTASGNYSQLMFAGKNNYYDLMKRDYISGSWGEWSYVTDRNKLNISVGCDHEYEITGKTGHEYAVAVPDGQVLIKRIHGQTRRKSLNLIDGFYCETSATSQYASSFKCTKLDVSVGKQYTINFKTVNTGAELYVNENLFSFKSFRCDGREYTFVFTCQNIADKFIIFKNTIDNTGRFDSMPVYNIQILEGDYTNKDIPTYQDYDDTLVNSKCNLKSTGRNFFNLDDLEQESGSTITPITKSEFTWSDIGNRDSTSWRNFITKIYDKVGDFYLCFYSDSNAKIFNYLNFVNGELWTNQAAHITSNTINLWMANEGFSNIHVKVMVSKNQIVYEPYEESSMLVDKELGEFDYIDNVGHLLVKQTSELLTFDGSSDEDWVSDGVDSSTGMKRFRIYLTKDFYGNTGTDLTKGVVNLNRFAENLGLGAYNSTKEGWNLERSYGNTKLAFTTTIQTLEEWKAYLQANAIQFVYKLLTLTTEPIQLEAGYQVWNSGLQIQETETLPYILEKEYAISLYSQILAVTSIVNSIPDDVVSKSRVEQTYIKKDAFSIAEDGKLIIDV